MNTLPASSPQNVDAEPPIAHVTQAIRCQFREGELFPPEMTGMILTRLEERLDLPVTSAPEPPIEQFPERPQTVIEGILCLRALADNQAFGYTDLETANAFLDHVEEMLGLPLTYATEPQVAEEETW